MKAVLAEKCCWAIIVKVSSLTVQPELLDPSSCSVAWDTYAKKTVGGFYITLSSNYLNISLSILVLAFVPPVAFLLSQSIKSGFSWITAE